MPVGTITALALEWEYCEVTWSARGFLANDTSYFWAQDMVSGDEVLRSAGSFHAQDVTETSAYPADDRRTHAVADELTQHLKDEGWEPLTTSGRDWWNLRFRRKIVG